MANEIEVLE